MTERARASFTLALSFLAFVTLGLPDGVLGVAWPSIRGSFALPLDALGALLVAATTGYVAASFASGWLAARMTVGSLLGGSCALTAASLIGYAAAPAWEVMVACGLLAGLGAGAIDAGLNSHVAARHDARTLNLLHACYGLGATAGPLVMTGVLAAGSSWRGGYALLGAGQLALMLCFLVTRRLWPRPATASRIAARQAVAPAPLATTLRLRGARLGIVSFFLYVGIEATAGTWIYSLLREARGLPATSAAAAVSVYWGGLLGGRLLFGMAPGRFHGRSLPGVAAATVAVGAGMLMLTSSAAACLVATATIGLACGPIFPSLIAATPRRLGAHHAANGVGFQIAAAALGQSLLPALAGVAADDAGLEAVPVVLAVTACLLVVVLQRLDTATSASMRGSACTTTETHDEHDWSRRQGRPRHRRIAGHRPRRLPAPGGLRGSDRRQLQGQRRCRERGRRRHP